MRNSCAVVASFLVVWGFLQVLSENEKLNFEVVKPLLQNKAVMDSILRCIKDDNNCSRFGRELKVKAKSAYTSLCANCTEQEWNTAKQFFGFLNATGQWDELMQAFDPESIHREDFETRLAT